MPRRMSVWPVAIHTLTPEIGIIGAVRVSARRERPSASQDPPPPRSASVLPPRTRSRSFQGRQSQLPEPHPQSAPAQNRSALLRASAAATQKVDLDEPRRCRSLTRNPHRRKTGRRCCAHLPPLNRRDDFNPLVHHVTIPMNTHMTHTLTQSARRPLSEGYA